MESVHEQVCVLWRERTNQIYAVVHLCNGPIRGMMMVCVCVLVCDGGGELLDERRLEEEVGGWCHWGY